MAAETNASSSCSEEEVQERNARLPERDFTDVVLWGLQELTRIDQRLYSTGVFYLTTDLLQAQKIELLQLLMDHPHHVRQVWRLQTEHEKQVWLDDLTDVLVWAIRELTLVFHRLYSAGIFEWADDFLIDQQMALLQLLEKPPDQLRSELLLIQQQQGKDGTGKTPLHGSGENPSASSEHRNK
ncbi:MAG: hypothetical protein ACE5OZ_18355 [Candidatus Heimdallarchaeota archaeon]